MIDSPILEIELHKIFDLYPDILFEIFLESNLVSSEKINDFEIFYSAYKNRLHLKSGIPDLIVGIRGYKEHYLVELKTLSDIDIQQMTHYMKDATTLLNEGKYPHNIEKFIPLYIKNVISMEKKELLNNNNIFFIELSNLKYNNIENIIQERDRRFFETRKVRKEIKTISVNRAAYILPLLDFLYEKYLNSEYNVRRQKLLENRSEILPSEPEEIPKATPPFQRISNLGKIAEFLKLIVIHRKGNKIIGFSLSNIGVKVAKLGMNRPKRIMFTPNQLKELLPILCEDPFANHLIYGIFAMLETIVELGSDNSEGHIKDVFKHKVGICQKEDRTIDSAIRFYLHYCEDLGLILMLKNNISPSEIGRIAYRILRINEVEALAKQEILSYL